MSEPMRLVTLSPANKFTFVCPLFDAKTMMGHCVQLRDIVWKGKTFPKRLGCQAAMKCGKCPASELISMHIFNGTWNNDFHGSREAKEGKLHAAVLARIERVVMQESVMNALGVSSAERQKLADANERIAQQLKTAPGEAPERASSYDAPRVAARKASKPAPRPVTDKINEAARTGDMSAAISA